MADKEEDDLSPMARVMTTDSRMLSCQPRSSRIPTVTTKMINGKAKIVFKCIGKEIWNGTMWIAIMEVKKTGLCVKNFLKVREYYYVLLIYADIPLSFMKSHEI